jgi:predicted dehydrogenase
MAKEKLNVAVVGCGVISRAHCEAVNANDQLVSLYAVCDIVEEKALEAAKKYNAKKYYVDYMEMLKDENIDIVCIGTPSGNHADIALACAKAGKHVLCEKPIDITKEQLDRLEEAFSGDSPKFATVFQYRTYPGLLKAKQMLDSGELGRIHTANGYCKVYRSPEYYKSAGWRGTWKYDGGGCLMNQAIHTLDVLCWLMGGAESALAKTYTLARDIEVEDTAFAILTFKNGAPGVFHATTLAYPGVGVEVEIICEKGRIVFNSSGTVLYTSDEKGNTIETSLDKTEKGGTENDPAAISNIGHAFLIKDLAEAIIYGRETHIPVKEGRHSVDVILAIYESSRKGGEVKVR